MLRRSRGFPSLYGLESPRGKLRAGKTPTNRFRGSLGAPKYSTIPLSRITSSRATSTGVRGRENLGVRLDDLDHIHKVRRDPKN
jgi:hypothetical protein